MIFGNPSQNEAVQYCSGSCLILAGPGSGKTFVLTNHILYLVTSAGVPPEKIAAFTFSAAAAAQMNSRFLKISEGKYPGIVFSTFHAFFYRFLSSCSREPLRIIPNTLKTGFFRRQYEAFGNGAGEDAYLMSEDYRNAYREFLSERNLTDFDRILEDSLLIPENRIPSGCNIFSRFSHIIVDEFQDISPVQYSLMERMGLSGTDYYAVGDDDQSIYSFRGAEPDIFRRFLSDHKDCRIFRLPVNYRSVPAIGRASSQLITQNRNRMKKKQLCVRKPLIILKRPDKTPIPPFTLSSYSTTEEECGTISDLLSDIIRQYPECRTAVLFRTNYAASAYLEHFDKTGTGFYSQIRPDTGASAENPAIRKAKDIILAYFRCASSIKCGSIKREDLFIILNCPERFLRRSLFPVPEVDLKKMIRESTADACTSTSLRLLLADLELLSALTPPNALKYLLESVFSGKDLYGNLAVPPEAAEKAFFKAVREIASSAFSVRDFIRILSDFSPPSPAPASRPGPGSPRVMTMHQSKGLEFDCVFLPGLNEGIIPVRSASDEAALEEERRILYVAMTRAREYLFLSYVRGSREHSVPKSRFLDVFSSAQSMAKRANPDENMVD